MKIVFILLLINKFSIHNLPRTCLYVIHSSNLFPGIVRLQLLRNSLCLLHLLYDPFKTSLCLFFYIYQITVQSVTHEQIKIYIPAVFLQILQMSLSPYPHMFRRTKATNLYQDGTELELVSRILGHSSTETTRIYAVPSIDMMRKVMESGNLESDERPLWTDDETEMARICGLR